MTVDGQVTRTARFLAALLGLSALSGFYPELAGAVYLENQPTVVVQPDGSEVPCLITGDEFFHRVHDAAGYTLVRDPATGYLVYAARQGDDLAPTGLVAGRDDPERNGLERFAMPSPARLRQLREGLPYMAGDGAKTPPTGTINNLMVLVRFKDQTEFADSSVKFDRTFNSAASGYNSLRNYFQEASYGATMVSTTFYPIPGTFVISFQDTFNRSYYCPYDASTNPEGYTGGNNGAMRTAREHALLRSAVNAIASQVPAGLDIDADGDGRVDNVCFVVRGPTTAWATLLWSHRWALYSYNVQINGKRVWDYNFQMETQFSTAVLCHEMGHSFGYPDLYHYNYGTSLSPTGPLWMNVLEPVLSCP
jgi:M6 family metalloprotease-like protein